MNWTQRHPGLTMARMVGLLLFLGWPSTLDPPATAADRAEGSRRLTIISGTAGVILGVVAGMPDHCRNSSLRFDVRSRLDVRGTPLLLYVRQCSSSPSCFCRPDQSLSADFTVPPLPWHQRRRLQYRCVRAGISGRPHTVRSKRPWALLRYGCL